MPKRLLATGAAILLLTVPASAQFSMGGTGNSGGAKTRYTEEEKRNEAESEKAYRDAIKNTRGATNEAYDPWRNIRPGTPEKVDNKKR
jgi:hypothetical protein